MKCEGCSCYYSCQYMQHRFVAKECEEHDIQVSILHSLELREREELLQVTKTIWNTKQPAGYKYTTKKIYG